MKSQGGLLLVTLTSVTTKSNESCIVGSLYLSLLNNMTGQLSHGMIVTGVKTHTTIGSLLCVSQTVHLSSLFYFHDILFVWWRYSNC